MSLYPIPLTLHIGYPRTATTLLQQKLAERNDHILFLGRKVGGKKGQRWLEPQLYEYWEWVRFGQIDLDTDKAAQDIYNILARAKDEGKVAAVISDETLSKPHKLNWYDGLAERIKKIFPHAQILLTLRNQVELVFSMYGLYLRRQTGGVYPVSGFGRWVLEGAGSNYVPVQERFNYYNLYKALRGHFDQEDINVLFYEDFRQSPKEYIADLCRVFGVGHLDLDAADKVNVSAKVGGASPLERHLVSRGGGLYNVRVIRRFPKLLDMFYSKILRRSIDWEKFMPSDSQNGFLSSLFYESNDRLARLAGLDLNAYAYPTLELMKKKYPYFQNGL